MADSAQSPRGGIDRRTFIKTVGVGGTVAAAGPAADQLGIGGPVGEADALGFTTGLVVGAAVIGGLALIPSKAGTDGEVSAEDVLEDRLYNIGTSVADGRDEFEAEMKSEFIDRPTNNTPYATSAWQALRAEAAKVAANGGSKAEAENKALEAIDRQTTRSVVNIIERWNTGVEALTEAITMDFEENVGVFELGTTDHNLVAPSDTLKNNWSPVDSSNVSGGGYAIWEESAFDLPMPADQLEGREEPLKIYAPGKTNAGGTKRPFCPQNTYFTNFYPSIGGPLNATHSDLSTQSVLDASLYSDILGEISSAYQSITNDLTTYVSNVHDAINQGAIDPSDVFTPEDLMDEFAGSSQQARLAAELMAIGSDVPTDAGMRVQVGHPDLQADKLWGWLYPQFTGDPVQPTPGEQIAAADYRIAYLGYYSAVTDEFLTTTLSGDSPITVYDVDGLDGQVQAPESSRADTVGTNGEITVWQGGDAPEQLVDPGSYSDWRIVVQTENGSTVTRPITDVTTDGSTPSADSTFKLASSTLTEGSTVESIDIQPSTGYTNPVTTVSDATQVNSTEIKNQLEEQRQTIEDLKEALDDSSGGGGFSLPGFLDTGGIIGGALVLGGLVLGVPKLLESNE